MPQNGLLMAWWGNYPTTATKRQHGPAGGLTEAQVPQAAGHAEWAFSLENAGVSALSGSQGTVNTALLDVAALASLSGGADEKETATNLCPLLRRLWKNTPFSSKT